GMTVPEEYGGLGLGITSYNRVLEAIGARCGSTAVMVSAHQSIGCKAIMLFGTEEQKQRYLPKVAREYLSAFCLSEPQVGSDAAGQETWCKLSDDGSHYILNGEKKWSTSGALSGMFTVMSKQRRDDGDVVTALICTPDMDGVEIFEKNRSKTGIRGTWQARIRFNNVRIPKENLLHGEGKGLKVALTCLNFGRCTLSAGITGAARQAADQSTKWVQTRYQFGRPLAEFELVQERIAGMAARIFALDAMLYIMTGMLDRGDDDIMVETAMTKVFCSQVGWEVIDESMEIMGGEGYMTENELERLWRDSRIFRIVEGSNEVMQPFIFAYGGKQLAEQMIGIQEALGWDGDESVLGNMSRFMRNAFNPKVAARAIPLAAELFMGYRPSAPDIDGISGELRPYARRLADLVRRHANMFKLASKWYRDEIVTRQAVQARLADSAIYLFALSASLSKMDSLIREGATGVGFDRDRTAFEHAFDLFELRIEDRLRSLKKNADSSMLKAASAARAWNDTLPNELFYIHESSPNAAGTGKNVDTEAIRQFPGDDAGKREGAGAVENGRTEDVDVTETTSESA
ncbi:MAG: acyl-CoA dehydrogenase, partial [Rhodothermales bacterium]|nr:acyl-CoA dehydrogenase [Rhodothermales bacterium]